METLHLAVRNEQYARMVAFIHLPIYTLTIVVLFGSTKTQRHGLPISTLQVRIWINSSMGFSPRQQIVAA